jgi:hypothetical protein
MSHTTHGHPIAARAEREMSFAHHEESHTFVDASPEALFAYLDDPRRLGGHMEKPSAMMLGGSMRYVFDAGEGRVIGSVIRMNGDVLGLKLALDESITERTGARKVWETRGEPRLLVIGRYRMGFEIEPAGEGSNLRLFIDFDPPQRGFSRFLGSLFGRPYARWCVERMAQDAARHFPKKG